MLLNIVFIAIILLSLSMVGLSFNILFRKKGKFPAYRVGHNPAMKKLGISCASHDELKCYRKSLRKTDKKECADCKQVTG
ncbi:MAG: hypothetical protein JXR52_00825 [Bacteroidales bacterium]|nr:hypothetical protein [Bacteroidales bacterium]